MIYLLLMCLSVGSVDYDELSARLHLDAGMAYLQQGLLSQAEEEFGEALDSGSGCPSAILGLGMVSMRRSSWDTAEGYFREYMSVCPEDHRGFLELSKLYMETGKTDSAAMMADSAYLRAPTEPEIWLQCGTAYYELGDMTSAESWFSRGMEEQGETLLESLVMLASVYRRTERGQEARELLMPAVENGYAPAAWELARVYLGWGDYMRAEEAIGKYLMLAPDGYYADSAALVLEELAESGDYIR